MQTSMQGIFQDKLFSLKKKISKHLSHPKKIRNKVFLKSLLKESKKLKRLLKDMNVETIRCPHCGKEIDNGRKSI